MYFLALLLPIKKMGRDKVEESIKIFIILNFPHIGEGSGEPFGSPV